MKKILKILKNIVTWGLVIVSIGVMIFTIISVTTFDRADRDLWDIKLLSFYPIL